MNKRSKNILLTLTLIAFTYFSLKPENIVKSQATHEVCILPSYNSETTEPVPFDIKNCLKIQDPAFRQGELRFQGQLTVNASGLFDNLLQTADGNSGLRVELNGNHAVGILVKSHKRWAPLIFHYVKGFPFKVPLDFDLTINADLNLIRLKFGENNFESKSEISFRPELGRFLLGQGFDSTRKLNGEFKNFKVSYTTYNYLLGINPKWARSLWVATCLILTIFSVHFFLRAFND